MEHGGGTVVTNAKNTKSIKQENTTMQFFERLAKTATIVRNHRLEYFPNKSSKVSSNQSSIIDSKISKYSRKQRTRSQLAVTSRSLRSM